MQPFGSPTQFPLNIPTGETTPGGTNVSDNLIPAGTTTTQTNIPLGCSSSKYVAIVTKVTAGTSVTITISGITASGFTYVLLTSAAVASGTTIEIQVGPNLPVTANVSANAILPPNLLITATVNTSATFGVDYILNA